MTDIKSVNGDRSKVVRRSYARPADHGPDGRVRSTAASDVGPRR